MKILLKKVSLFFLSFLVLVSSNLTILAPSAHAQSTWYNSSFPEWYLKVYDEKTSTSNEIFGERYTAAQVQWIVYGIIANLINIPLMNAAELRVCAMQAISGTAEASTCMEAIKTFISNLKTTFTGMGNGSGSTVASQNNESIISQIFKDRPFSGITYVKNVGRKINLVPKVIAAEGGFGFNAFEPISALWKITRNISYFLFVIVTVVFAFMIMFRVKLNPQTAITIQSALPKIILALILVTFSFAIAGFMVDLIYVIMGVFSVLLTSVIPFGAPIAASAVFGFINGSLITGFNHDYGLSIIVYFVFYWAFFICDIVAIFLAAFFSLNVSSIIFSLVLVIFWVVLTFILLWYMCKTIFVLFKNLAAVYALVIIAPLQITMGTLFPQSGFGPWLKKLFSKLIVFPLTGTFIYLAFIFLSNSAYFAMQGLVENNFLVAFLNDAFFRTFLNVDLTGFEMGGLLKGSLWGPPMLGNPAAATAIAFLLMSVGLIMMIPKISDAIEAFMAGKSLGPTGIGEALGPFGQIASGAQKYGIEEGTRWAAGRARTEIASRAGQRGIWGPLNRGLYALSGNKPPTSKLKTPGDINSS